MRMQQPQPIGTCRREPAAASANPNAETQGCSDHSQLGHGGVSLQLPQPIRKWRQEAAATEANQDREP